MKTLPGVVLSVLAAFAIIGCASQRFEVAFHAGDEQPPEFLAGPIAVLLTNVDGFSAHLVATTSSGDGLTRTNSGELIQREGRLIFQPAVHLKRKRKRVEGGLFFIWDESRRSGYVLSEALQGYAPIKSDLEVTSLGPTAREGNEEEANGHPCFRTSQTVGLSDGATARFTIWQADDARRFPIRIEMVNGPEKLTVNFSELRLELPDQELFSPPDGFTPYASAVSLMNELIVRDTTLASKSYSGEFTEPAPAHATGGSWQQPQVR